MAKAKTRPPASRRPAPAKTRGPGGIASALHAQIDRNVDAFYDGEISHEEFSRRQRAAWEEIRRAGVEDGVLARIRSELPVAPARASRPDLEREIRVLASPRR